MREHRAHPVAAQPVGDGEDEPGEQTRPDEQSQYEEADRVAV